jgi:hypothetical protein
MDNAKLISLLQQVKALTEECLAGLEESAATKGRAKKPAALSHETKPKSIEFDLPMRPFIKRYAKDMSGAHKFVLLLSRIVKGNLKQTVDIVEIERQWNKLRSKPLLGMEFNRSYTGRAKDNDWVDSNKKGLYFLRPSWKKIFC